MDKDSGLISGTLTETGVPKCVITADNAGGSLSRTVTSTATDTPRTTGIDERRTVNFGASATDPSSATMRTRMAMVSQTSMSFALEPIHSTLRAHPWRQPLRMRPRVTQRDVSADPRNREKIS